MLAVRENGNNLVLVTESGDEWADMLRPSEVVQKVQFVKDAYGAAGYINLLYGDVAWSRTAPLSLGRRCPSFVVLFVEVPIVAVFVVFEVFSFVYR